MNSDKLLLVPSANYCHGDKVKHITKGEGIFEDIVPGHKGLCLVRFKEYKAPIACWFADISMVESNNV